MENKLEIDDICIRTKMKCPGLYKVKKIYELTAIVSPLQDFGIIIEVPLAQLEYIARSTPIEKFIPDLDKLILDRNKQLKIIEP